MNPAPRYHCCLKNENPQKLSYQDAGVSIDRGNRLIEQIKSSASSTHGKGVMGNLGGFGALFDIGAMNYKDPVLVSGTDGVGTKLKLAVEMNQHSTIGIDLVAMCVNDILVQGASPLFFLDYFACGELDVDTASDVINGIAQGCRLAGCALIGGETAEMPGMYTSGEYDLAGFCVGAVERENIIDGSSVQAGDTLIGIASSGPHSNGYSLIRKVLEVSSDNLTTEFGGKTLGQVLLEPTKIYVSSIKQLFQTCDVKTLSHITGGGLIENLPRVIPDNTQVNIESKSWSLPPIFEWLQKEGNIESQEMYRTFNCGVGMVVCVSEEDKDKAIKSLKASGETAWEIGKVEAKQEGSQTIRFI
ncbi:MAG: phosphoribosylformylglycinamidine cyclo-ligase [Gammaproteobacteria bacterium]|jgi:phosphoribosylformylglycinamidine cyclo-ligase